MDECIIHEDTSLLECIIIVLKEHGAAAVLRDNGTISAYPVQPYLFKRVKVKG